MIHLQIFTNENQKHHGILLYEWILEEARKMRIPEATAYRAIAGFGKNGNLREEHFFELSGNMPIQISLILTSEDAEVLIKKFSNENLDLFYTQTEVKTA